MYSPFNSLESFFPSIFWAEQASTDCGLLFPVSCLLIVYNFYHFLKSDNLAQHGFHNFYKQGIGEEYIGNKCIREKDVEYTTNNNLTEGEKNLVSSLQIVRQPFKTFIETITYCRIIRFKKSFYDTQKTAQNPYR